MTGSPRLGLPFLSAGQAQKELFHNEALQLLDFAVGAAVEELPRAAAPETPAEGACYLIAPGATGEWAGRDGALAGYSGGGWRYLAPLEGMAVYVRSEEVVATFRSGAWEVGALRGSALLLGGQQVVGTRGAAIAAPAGGATVDAEARTAIGLILAAMRSHGLIES
ncbi:MAG TPA: DUF2793 domain-containing protein [Sphingomicrobium sp.]|jgi:hypothetical protein|nr:DUF2793 domain-containing protein [Sphingomicrobium sp.]